MAAAGAASGGCPSTRPSPEPPVAGPPPRCWGLCAVSFLHTGQLSPHRCKCFRSRAASGRLLLKHREAGGEPAATGPRPSFLVPVPTPRGSHMAHAAAALPAMPTCPRRARPLTTGTPGAVLCHLPIQAHLVCLGMRSRPQSLRRSPHVTLGCRTSRLSHSCSRRSGLHSHCSLGERRQCG